MICGAVFVLDALYTKALVAFFKHAKASVISGALESTLVRSIA